MRILLNELLHPATMNLKSPPDAPAGGGNVSGGEGDAGDTGSGGGGPASAGDAGVAGADGDGSGEDAGEAGDGDGASGDANGAAQEFPENWRQQLAGEDKSALKSLNRYKAPQDMWKALQQQTRQISERGLSRPKDGASDKEWATWRDDNGIPNAVEDFKIELSDGRTMGDDDKPIADSLMNYSIEKSLNLTQDQMNGLFDWYFSGLLEQSANSVIENDDQMKADTLTILTDDWGADYRGNIARGELVFKDASQEFTDMMGTARDGRNRIISQTPEYKQEMARLARMIYPSDIPIGGDINASIKDLATRRSELQKMMGDGNSEYWKGPSAQNLQAEYRDIVDSESRLKA